MGNKKYYVVWEGLAPGIYDSWEECQLQTTNYKGARFKSFPTLEEATEAYRGNPSDYMGLFKAMAQRRTTPQVNYDAIPEIRTDAIAVDAACSRNPGPVEYKGVRVATGEEIFKVGPLQGGSNNIGEYLAIIHAAALLARSGDFSTPIYTDSRTALSWVNHGGHRSKIAPGPSNVQLMEILGRADAWLRSNGPVRNPLIKWNTEQWGEIPADFGRKH